MLSEDENTNFWLIGNSCEGYIQDDGSMGKLETARRFLTEKQAEMYYKDHEFSNLYIFFSNCTC